MLFVSLALVLMGGNLLTPLMALYAQRFDISSLVLALTFAAYVGTLLPVMLLLGSVSDRLGRRRVLQFALGALALAAVVLGAASSASDLMVGRAIQGAGVGIGSATATAAIVDVSTSPRRAGVMAALAMLIGAGSGTLLSGLISAHAPWPTTTPFLVYTALLLPATLALNFVPETVQRSSGRLLRPLPRLGLKSPARSAFASAATIGACATSTNTVVVTLLPLLLLTTTRVNDRQATGIVIAIYLAFGGFAQLAFQRQGAATKCVIGLLALSAGIVAAAFSHHHLVVMEVGIVVAGAGSGVAWGGSLSYCAEQLPPARRAELLSAYYASSYILNTVAVVVVGGTADRVGLGVAFTGFSFAVVVLSTLAGVMVWRDGRALRRARMDDLF